MSKHSTQSKVKILVVDDEIDICEYLIQLLTTNNYDTSYINDPLQTIPLLRRESFQIVILDIIMPGMNGLELLKEIREYDNDICIILLTAYPTFDRAVDAMRGYAFDFLTKPFDVDVLLSTLRRAVDHYGLQTNLDQRAIDQIAQVVRNLRKENKLSLTQLARRTGLSTSLISQIEHAKSSPSIATISRLAAALGSPLEKFFTGL